MKIDSSYQIRSINLEFHKIRLKNLKPTDLKIQVFLDKNHKSVNSFQDYKEISDKTPTDVKVGSWYEQGRIKVPAKYTSYQDKKN
ncbi:hypothetical protein [Mycoplasma bradburyae]|uniref:hypothetical protein n=1 Tax=Mycoplasma bradburyae TaxID=2963128 RepID=UPI0020CC353F|nr:hypothetical protein [Mycoplasma bradburyae]UTS70543.1 hypothetical protein NMG77_02200 [Mycoplasma bradburyae]